MNITEHELRRIIREAVCKACNNPSDPIAGLTGLMQEYDVPMSSRQGVAQALHKVHDLNGGPLDFSYEAEKVKGFVPLPEDFYSKAISMVRNNKVVHKESRRIKLSRRQVSLLVREVLNKSDRSVLSEAELNEIAPAIAALVRVAPRLIPHLARGARGVAKYVKKNPKNSFRVARLINKAKDKMPNLSKHMDDNEIPTDGSDAGSLIGMIEDPPDKINNELDKVLKSAAAEAKRAEKCDCPDIEEIEQAKKDLGIQ